MSPAAVVRCTLLALLALGCDRTPNWPPSPAALRAGEDVCAECRMFVSDARFAVQLHSRAGAVEWFDDLGCLLAKYERGTEPVAVFARDFTSEAWVRGDVGQAVQVPGVDSPMGYGWTVHASASAAQAAVGGNGAKLAALSALLLRGPSETQQTFTEAPATMIPGEDRR